jgi:hypothetical protein
LLGVSLRDKIRGIDIRKQLGAELMMEWWMRCKNIKGNGMIM